MKAIFIETRLLRACAWLSKRAGYPILCFTRNGEYLHIMGTTGYTMVEGDVLAEFEDWPDGEGKKVSDWGAIKQLARALKRDNDGYPCSVEIGEHDCAVNIGGDDMTHRAIFTNIGKPPTMKDELTDEPEGSAFMSIDYLDESIAVMRKFGMIVNGWRIIPHGKNKAMFFLLEDAPLTRERNVRVMAMTRRED